MISFLSHRIALFLKDNDSMEQYILQIVKIKKYK